MGNSANEPSNTFHQMEKERKILKPVIDDICAICAGKIPKTLKGGIYCSDCNQEFCSSCCQKYILESVVDPKCPGCFRPWNRRMMFEYFGANFLATKFKDKRENDVFELEKAKFPEAIQEMARARLQDFMQDFRKLNFRIIYEDEVFNQQEREDVERVREMLYTKTELAIDNPPPVRKKNIFKCPEEGCRGFVTNDYCEICRQFVCDKCRTIEDDCHECDKDLVETVKLLKKDTKECPKCSVPINKIDGCDQMWCPQCQTAFSWKTREIVTGRIHNPHYYEFMRTQGPIPREPGDECGDDLPPLDFIGNDDLREFHRLILHVRYLLTTLRPQGEWRNVELRIQFLKGKISEQDFKSRVQKRFKLEEKNDETRAILTTFDQAGTDILRASMNAPNKQGFVDSLRSLQQLCNENLHEVSKIFKMNTPSI